MNKPRNEEVAWSLAPDEQAWWWHWNGEDYAIPHIYSVLVSKTGPDRYFIQYPDSRWCDEIGGFWLKVQYPNVPTRTEQADLAGRRATKEHEDGESKPEII